MRLTAAAVLFSLTSVAGLSFMGQAEAEQDFHPIWCPQATSYYVQLREALDPLRAATVAHDLDIAKAKRQGNPPKPATAPPVNQHYKEDQPPYTDDGNPLRPRHPSPPVPPPQQGRLSPRTKPRSPPRPPPVPRR